MTQINKDASKNRGQKALGLLNNSNLFSKINSRPEKSPASKNKCLKAMVPGRTQVISRPATDNRQKIALYRSRPQSELLSRDFKVIYFFKITLKT